MRSEMRPESDISNTAVHKYMYYRSNCPEGFYVKCGIKILQNSAGVLFRN